MAKTPSSFTAPKRFFTARTRRKLECGIAFEVEHRVDDVLEHARPGDGAFLGHVADHEQRRARALGVARELRRALAHLRDRARRRLQRLGPDRLDRVDHRDARPRVLERAEDTLELGLGEQAARRRRRARAAARAAPPARPTPRPRRRACLPRRFQPAHAPAAAASTCRCRGRRRAAPPGPPPGRRPARGRAPPMPVGMRSRSFASTLGQHHRRRPCRCSGALLLRQRFGQRAGGAAGRAAAEPLQRGRAAVGADVRRLGPRHQAISCTGTRGARAQSSS